jgi:nicotinate phosphoribosyltransferase
MDNRKLELVTDFYELTMSNCYFTKSIQDIIAYFDVFFRKIPDEGGYVIFAGLEQVIDYVKNLKFDEDDISYLKGLNKFSDEFLNYLKSFKFTGTIWAVPEGTVVFPNEPLITVKAPIIEAQILETALLCLINHQSLIATKSSRIVRAAKGRPVMEFGARRAHSVDAAVYGARAAVIGGCVGTSCTLTAKEFNVSASGTMAHSFIQAFDSEYEAFKVYAENYPDDCTLLIDTYDTLNSGIQNAIKVFNEVLVPNGYRPKAVRLDSGDLSYLSKKIRKILDEAGFEDCKICGTNALDEYIITSILDEGAKLDLFGVGENLITAKSNPVFGGVYKLVAIEKDGKIIPKIKISDNTIKITNPGFKKVYRFYDNNTNKALADVITLNDEVIPSDSYTIFDPANPWKKKTLKNYTVRPIQELIFDNGKLVYTSPSLKEISENAKKELDTLWSEVKRMKNPHKYYVDLSQKLWDLKNKLLEDKK